MSTERISDGDPSDGLFRLVSRVTDSLPNLDTARAVRDIGEMVSLRLSTLFICFVTVGPAGHTSDGLISIGNKDWCSQQVCLII